MGLNGSLNVVSRQEVKYLVPYGYMVQQRHYLRQLMEEDPHNREDGYTIRSLYFDTVDNRDFEEKEDGIELRRKLRLRIYSPHDKTAKLEMKQKEGTRQRKRTLTMTREDARQLIAGDYSVLLGYPESFAQECYVMMCMHCYRPVSVVDYKRFALVAKENDIRITFDYDIVATEANLNIFDEELLQYPVFDKYNVVLEVKYNGFLLSYVKDLLASCDRMALSVSKYCLSRTGTTFFFV